MRNLLLALLVVAVTPINAEDSKESKANAIVTLEAATQLASVVSQYVRYTGSIPDEETGLQALTKPPRVSPVPRRWKKFLDKLPKDQWGNDFVLVVEEVDGQPNMIRMGILSKGPNEELGGGDEVLVSWFEKSP